MLHRSVRIERERIGAGSRCGVPNRMLMVRRVANGKSVLSRGGKIVADVALSGGIPNFYRESTIALPILGAFGLHPDWKRPARKRIVSVLIFSWRGTLGYESFRHKNSEANRSAAV